MHQVGGPIPTFQRPTDGLGCDTPADARDRRQTVVGRRYSHAVDRLNEQAALVALLRRRKRGWATVADQVELCGSAYEVLVGDGDELGQGALFDTNEPPDVESALDDARAHILAWQADGMQLVTLLDPDYPAQLLAVHQRPPFLFYRGRLDVSDQEGIAIVGTRSPTAQGLQTAQEIATGVAARQVTVISGLAKGIDSAAHTAALEAGGRTVGVIGTGLQVNYPAENRRLQHRIAQEHLVLSQFWPTAPPTKQSFPMRNAVMSGYAAATVVVEAADRSGARMQARMALEHGRPVFLMKGLMEHEWARTYSQRPGVHVVDDVDEVLATLDEELAPMDGLVWA